MKKLVIIFALSALPALALANPDKPHRRGDEMGEHHRRGAELLEKVRERYPEKYERLMKLRKEDPEAFRHAMRSLHHKMMFGDDAKDPAIRERKDHIRGLMEQFKEALEDYRDSGERKQDQTREELESLANEIFNAKQEFRRNRLKRVQEKVQELKAEIAERDAQKDELIQDFIQEKTEQQDESELHGL